MQKHNFGLIFKSGDAGALEKVIGWLNASIPDSKIVFRCGPTSRFLWNLEGKSGGVTGEHTAI
jgi:hypothetical protein